MVTFFGKSDLTLVLLHRTDIFFYNFFFQLSPKKFISFSLKKNANRQSGTTTKESDYFIFLN